MDCCKRLLAELARPEEDRDGVVPLALWTSALVTYARCFGPGDGSGLTDDEVRSLPLQGAVMNFHEWVIGECGKLTGHSADPFEAARIGAALSPPAKKDRRVEGIAVFATNRVLIDATGVQQLGALASELAKQAAAGMQEQQDTVLSDAQRQDLDRLYGAPPLPTQRPATAGG